MASVRSPNFPSMDLAGALVLARKVYDKDHRNKISRLVLAKHLGHETITGPALQKTGALRAYGLIEGSGDQIRVSDDAVTALMAPEGPDRLATLARLAVHPPLFKDIKRDFPTGTSEENLQFWLIKRHFTPEAAKKATKTYLATMKLVNGAPIPHDSGLAEEEGDDDLPPPDAEVGDLIQIEIDGVLQLEKARRVRAIREEQGQKWVFIEGSETGVRMDQVIVEEKAKAGGKPPMLPLDPPGNEQRIKANEQEWLRGPLSRETSYRLIVSGEVGPKDIGKLIKLLKAQKAVLDDEEDDEEDDA